MFNEKTSSNITDVRKYGHLGLIVKSLKVKCGATDFSTCVYTSLLLVVSKKLVWFDRID